MAAPSLTYTLTNGTTADASQVMQNFNDLLNGISDATKDLSISALTVAGTFLATGTSNTIGNSSGDDFTLTASLASHIPIKTTATYDIGATTLGLRSIYIGANSQSVRILGSASMSATWTLTLPVTAGSANYALITNGSGVSSWSSWTNSAWYASGATAGTVSPDAQAYNGVKTFNDGLKLNDSGGTDTLDYWKARTSFTPVIATDGSGYSSVTYVQQAGSYSRIGDLVFFRAAVVWSAASGGTGNLFIGGLPFTAAAVGCPVSLLAENIDWDGSAVLPKQLAAQVSPSSTGVAFFAVLDNGALVQLPSSAAFGGSFNKTLIVSGYYFV